MRKKHSEVWAWLIVMTVPTGYLSWICCQAGTPEFSTTVVALIRAALVLEIIGIVFYAKADLTAILANKVAPIPAFDQFKENNDGIRPALPKRNVADRQRSVCTHRPPRHRVVEVRLKAPRR